MGKHLSNQNLKTRDRKNPKKAKLDLVMLARVYRTFGRHYKTQWKVLVVAGVGLLGSVTMTLLQPWPLKLILDNVILQKPLPAEVGFVTNLVGTDPAALLVLFALSLIVITVVDSSLSYLYRYHLAAAGQGLITDVRQRLFAHLQSLSLSFHTSSQSGDVIYRLTSDISDLKNILIDAPQNVIYRILSFASITTVMLALDWRLGLISFSVVPILGIFTYRFGASVKKAARQKKKKESEVASIVAENVASMALVQAYGQESAEKARFGLENTASLESEISAIRLSKTFKRVTDFLIAVGTCTVVYYGARHVLAGDILPGTLVVFVAYLKKLYGPVDKFSMTMIDLAKSQVSGERLMEILETEIVVDDAPDAKPAPELRGAVEFRNVTFAYKKGVDVIKDLSFAARPGETVALVGHSGAGKSTLISLLLRFYDPQGGEILVDGENIKKFTLRSYRDQFTIVLQDAVIFHKTVRDNVAFGKPNASLDEVVHAAKLAQAHEFIMELPDGYDTVLWEGGDNLSGGQRQRISIARAILRDTPMVVLDEPSTGLDARAEAKVHAAIRELTDKKTTFVIAHKFSTIINADRILLLENGVLCDMGTHDQLMDSSPKYRRLYELQIGEPGDGESSAPGVAKLATAES